MSSPYQAGAQVTISGLTITGGSAEEGSGINNSGTLSVANCTISGNSANSTGGGIADSGAASTSFLTATNNRAPSGGGIAISAGSQPAVASVDSIYQNAQGGNVSVAAGTSFVSLGYNLFSDTPAISLAPTDLVDTNAMLGPLADNGGPTFTQALLPGSPAVSAGTPLAAITTDQRGAPRPQASAPISALSRSNPLSPS